jgi:hypothetical protein
MTTSPQAAPRDVRLVMLVNRYATPFAILLVVLGLVLASPAKTARDVSIALLLFSICFNVLAVGAIRKLAETMPSIKKLRMLINVAINVVLVYELGPFWQPMWLLLALTPIATAIYEGPTQTLLVSSGTSGLIIAIHLLRSGGDGGSPLEWGQTLSYAAFIILLSLLINELTQASYPNHPQDKK